MWPCPELTAYWTTPPSWPRRLLCDSIPCSCSRTTWLVVGAIVMTYFLVMDILLFTRFQDSDLVQDSKGGHDSEVYTPFTHLSIKGLLNDHPSQFFIAPSTEYFNAVTHFSSVFSFITPNMISVAHLLCGFISGKFMASENLADRRIGVILYEYRTWIDAFDGTVHRAQQGLHLRYQSDHSTLGYAIDSFADTLGGCFLCLSIFFYLVKRFSPSTHQPNALTSRLTDSTDVAHVLPFKHTDSNKEACSMRLIVWKLMTFALCLGVAGKCWDIAVEDFSKVFQAELRDAQLTRRQSELCHSTTSQVIFYLWRLFGGQSVLNYILAAIYMDKVWEFLKYLHYILLAVAVLLYIITAVYIHQIRAELHL